MSALSMVDGAANGFELDDTGVWLRRGHGAFAYSDGRSSERYLATVLRRASDLTSNSCELEQHIRDWPSEYHLSRKRAHLLRGFAFDPELRVLEVGSGCGAITRFLGEAFRTVVGVEGSVARARLARLRTRDQANVEVLCAPFQDVKFRAPFDIIFCVGVLEYAGSFLEGRDPFDAMLRYCRETLTPEGVLVVAIENQFGLKYWTSSREDHTATRFDGLEGYPRLGDTVRTFGYHELKQRLERHFSAVEFHFPYPDYKVPSCVLSEEFLQRVNAGELIASFPSRDYGGARRALCDEWRVLLELDKNRMLPFFASSFLVFAHKRPRTAGLTRACLGTMYSSERVTALETVTCFEKHADGGIWVSKRPVSPQAIVEIGPLRLQSSNTKWIDGLSIQTQVMRRSKERGITLATLFEPCRAWLARLRSSARREGDHLVVDGSFLDANWSNSYLVNGECVFIDREWEWKGDLDLNVLVIRNVYALLHALENRGSLVTPLRGWRPKRVITRVAEALGVTTTNRDFKEFCKLQAQITQHAFDQNYRWSWLRIWVGLELNGMLRPLRHVKAALAVLRTRIYRIGDLVQP